ncbi:glycoside hydrolase family 61 protein I [Dentipellis sp. KUC8613]|nr:glycoside hydrolase family 61 protein I [Dentipellis sp. KUC8613]
MVKLASLATFVALAASASAHTIFQELYVNGVDQGHINGIRVPDYDGPITDVTSNDLICNGGINPYHQPISKTVITVPAGAQVTTEWHHTLNGADPSDPADPIDPSHHGPVMAYLAQIPNATQSDVTGLKWFKIWEDGMESDQSWGVDRLIASKGKVSFTIPSCIAAGQYLLRAEIIALHAAESYPGAQFYMECAQLQITGGGNTSPATVSFPGAYKGTDPGVTINIYQHLNSYTVPGPPVFSCDGTAPPPPPQSTPPASSSSTVTQTSTSSAPSQSSGATAAHYAQCGGIGYTGPTVCAAPYTCVVSNQYYSQCL